MDALFLAAVLGFFLVTLALVQGCAKLGGQS